MNMLFNKIPVVILLVAFTLVVVIQDATAQDDPEASTVYSGPQIGEPLPNFEMKLGFGEGAGTEIDLVEQAGDQPVVIVFVHDRSRPAFGLANSVMRYCDQDGGDKLHRGICFLTADPTETATWMNRIKNYFPKNTPVGFSTDGIEGPGAYGLNRNVQLTVLVAKEKRVVANFALIQPGAHADGPRILAAIASATGAEANPDINKYLPSNQAAQDAPIAIDPGLMAQIRKINARDATVEMIDQGISEIETMIKDNKPLQNQLGSIVTRWVGSKRVDSIGNGEHQAKIKDWAQQFGPKRSRSDRQMDRAQAGRANTDPEFTNLLRSVIQKTNSDEQVDSAAKAVEQYIEKNPDAAKELARIANTVVNSGKLSNYGTPRAQETLKRWAEQFPIEK